MLSGPSGQFSVLSLSVQWLYILTHVLTSLCTMSAPVPLRYEKTASVSDFAGHNGGVAAVAFSPKGFLLASGGLDHKVCIWQTSNSQLLHTFVANSPVLLPAWVSYTLILCGMQDRSILALLVTEVSFIVSLRLPLRLFTLDTPPTGTMTWPLILMHHCSHPAPSIHPHALHPPLMLIPTMAHISMTLEARLGGGQIVGSQTTWTWLRVHCHMIIITLFPIAILLLLLLAPPILYLLCLHPWLVDNLLLALQPL